MKNTEKGSLFGTALHLYARIMLEPLQQRLFNVTISMIRDDRLNKVVTRSKIKDLIKVFEEIDLDCAKLDKEGDDLIWTGTQNLKKASDFVERFLIPEVKIIKKFEKINKKLIKK
jgi:hypothetical protein